MFMFYFEAGWEFPERAFPSRWFDTFKQTRREAYQRRETLTRTEPLLKTASVIIEDEQGQVYKP